MLKSEWKKLLIGRRGLWLIAVFLLAELAGIILFTEPYDKALEENREVYESYLSPLTGSLTAEKRAFVESEMDRLEQVHRKMEQLKQDYYSGSILEEEYRNSFQVLHQDDKRYPGFMKVYNQYIFVREQENRSFLYTGGWETLLTNQRPDYLYLILLIIVLSPIFCEEYASGMNKILITQKYSSKYHVAVKLGVALTLTAILTAILQCMELIYCAAVFGLPHGNFTIQSLHSFATASKMLTLWQAFALQFVLKEIGYCYAAILLLFLSVLVKKYALTLMAGTGILILPFLTVENSDAFLRIPAPWALMLGNIYLSGSKTYLDNQTGEMVTMVNEVSITEIGLLVGVVLLIALCMILVIRRKNSNYQMPRHSWRRITGIICIVTLFLSGCGKQAESVIYNSSSAAWCESEKYVLINTQQGAVLIDKQANTCYPFPIDACSEETVFLSSNFFYAEGKAYYVRDERYHPSGGFDYLVTDSYDLMHMDLNSLVETVRYQWNTEQTSFFGLLEKENTETQPTKINTFFIHNNNLCYLEGNTLYKMNLLTGENELYLDTLNSQDIAYDGKHLYYLDIYNRLVIRDLENETEQAIDKVVADRFLLAPSGIYFLNRRDNNTPYFWNIPSSDIIKLGDMPASAIYCDTKYLWVVDKNDNTLWRMKNDGTDKTAVSFEGTLCCISNGTSFYTIDYATGQICAVDKDDFTVKTYKE